EVLENELAPLNDAHRLDIPADVLPGMEGIVRSDVYPRHRPRLRDKAPHQRLDPLRRLFKRSIYHSSSSGSSSGGRRSAAVIAFLWARIRSWGSVLITFKSVAVSSTYMLEGPVSTSSGERFIRPRPCPNRR